MGDISVGDQVFDDRGQPCQVTFVSEVQSNRRCFDVTFSDGTVVTADAEHQWFTWDKAARKAWARAEVPRSYPQVRTTEEIKSTLMCPQNRERNHSIPCTEPLALPAAGLSVDPYVLGAWLGDGDSKAAVLTSVDGEVVGECVLAGETMEVVRADENKTARYRMGARPYQRNAASGRMEANGSLHSRLRQLGVLPNKHIPAAYLRASVEQRLSLLQGLMDTDGHVERGGAAEFTGVKKRLAEDVLELALSLGLKATMSEGRATLNGKDCGAKFRVRFTPHIPVCRLPRKAERCHAGKHQKMRVARRYIVDVKECSPVPVRCIQVNSPSHLFLCSRAMIPTHNTRTGAETVRAWEEEAKSPIVMALVGQNAGDVRDVMILGESGIMSCCPPWNKPKFIPSQRRLVWKSGSQCLLFSGDTPDQLRGPQFHFAWCDELAKFRYPVETWDNLELALRLGESPQALITTTPRPIPIIKALLNDPGTVITRGSSYENLANLAPTYIERVIQKYEGTRTGRQELHGEVLMDMPGALWTYELIERSRTKAIPEMAKLVVALDPAVSVSEDSDETGIVVCGLGIDGLGYVLEDRSGKYTPAEWGALAVELLEKWKGDRIVAEVNNGGDLVENVLRTAYRNVSYRKVHASRGKTRRAGPVAALFEQGKVKIHGQFSKMEDQMATYTEEQQVGSRRTSQDSPDRMDAMVWGITSLMLNPGSGKRRHRLSAIISSLR